MAEPLTSTQLENALKMAAKVVETFGDDWGLYYDSDGGEVSCRTDDEGPIEGSYVEVFSTSQWPSDSNHSPVAEFLSVSIVMVPRLVGEVERLRQGMRDLHARWLQRAKDNGDYYNRTAEKYEHGKAVAFDAAAEEIRVLAGAEVVSPEAGQAEQERAR
jgi:hypothetical protein